MVIQYLEMQEQRVRHAFGSSLLSSRPAELRPGGAVATQGTTMPCGVAIAVNKDAHPVIPPREVAVLN